MSLLLDPLPDCVEVSGALYRVKTDWRDWAHLSVRLSDRALSPPEQMLSVLSMYREGQRLPPTQQEAIAAILSFYTAEQTQTAHGKKEENSRAIFSFEYDGAYIYAAFLSEYGIDLLAAKMHWHAFMGLFRALSDRQQLVRIMQYRSMDLSKVKDKGQRAHYRKLKRLYALPDMRTPEEKEADLIRTVEQMF